MNKMITRARLAGRCLRYVPFLRCALLNGSLTRGEESTQSDIDILIIAKFGRLYTCRAFASALIHLTGWRRHGKKVAGRICLNCYLSDKSLSIIPEKKKSIPKVVRAYKYTIPLVDDGISREFFKVNKWFDRFEVKGGVHSRLLQETCFAQFPLYRGSVPRKIEQIFSGKFGDKIEQKLMVYQQKRILTGKRRGDEIFTNDKMIKLHPKKSSDR